MLLSFVLPDKSERAILTHSAPKGEHGSVIAAAAKLKAKPGCDAVTRFGLRLGTPAPGIHGGPQENPRGGCQSDVSSRNVPIDDFFQIESDEPSRIDGLARAAAHSVLHRRKRAPSPCGPDDERRRHDRELEKTPSGIFQARKRAENVGQDPQRMEREGGVGHQDPYPIFREPHLSV